MKIIVSKNESGKYIAYYEGDYDEDTRSGRCFEGDTSFEAVGKAVCEYGYVQYTSKTRA